ncbi:MAG: hypothetical protein KJ626_08280 [Verrucomicrobia bacterium]|nr:hypothetical protein [Verrucomicrobiota bacterium]
MDDLKRTACSILATCIACFFGLSAHGARLLDDETDFVKDTVIPMEPSPETDWAPSVKEQESLSENLRSGSNVTGENRQQQSLALNPDWLNRGFMYTEQMWLRIAAAEFSAAAGEWSNTASNLVEALASAPEQRKLLEKAAIAFHLSGNLTRANEYWMRLNELAPERYDVLTGWARTLLYDKRAQKAEALLNRALSKNPTWPPARFFMACAEMAQGTNAGPVHAMGILKVPDCIRFLYLLNSDDQALLSFLSPGQFLALCNYTLTGGRTPLTVPSGESTDEQAEEIQKTREKVAEAHRELVSIENMMRSADFERAIAGIRRARNLGIEGPYLDFYEAFALAATGQMGTARILMKKILDDHPDEVDFLYRYGTLLLEGEAFGEAAEVLEKGHRLASTRTDMAFALAVAYAGSDQPDKAFDVLDQLALKDPQAAAAWLRADFPALRRIRSHPRYYKLVSTLFQSVKKGEADAEPAEKEEP